MKKLLPIILAVLLAGCAGQAQLAKKTAFSVGADPSEVKVSNIGHGFFETDYNAIIDGQKYNCTAIGGNVMTFGIIVAPQCVPLHHGKRLASNSCNAMLRAAGRC